MNLPHQQMRAYVGGSSRGIGLGCAVSLADGGAEVTLFGRHQDTLREALEHLPTPTDQHHRFITADTTDWKAASAQARVDIAENGPVQILVCNTGGPGPGPVVDAPPDEFSRWFEQHVVFNQAMVQEVRTGMEEAGYGRIINIISSSVVTPIPNLGVSNTIRGAVAQWGKSLAAELAPLGITVNNVLPGSIDTTRLRTTMASIAERTGRTNEQVERTTLAKIPAGRLGTPADIGAVVAFLASPAASYVTGVNLLVDGGRLAVQ